MELRKEEFDEWRDHPVTRAVILKLKEYQETFMLSLAEDAGIDPLNDRYRVGRIHAYAELANITFEEANDSN
jgi:hypothetical protein